MSSSGLMWTDDDDEPYIYIFFVTIISTHWSTADKRRIWYHVFVVPDTHVTGNPSVIRAMYDCCVLFYVDIEPGIRLHFWALSIKHTFIDSK